MRARRAPLHAAGAAASHCARPCYTRVGLDSASAVRGAAPSVAPPVYPLLHRSLLRFMTISRFTTLSRGSRTQAETRVMNPQAGQHLEDRRGGQEVDERGGGVGVHEHAERKAAPLQRGLKLRPGGGRGGGRGQALGPSGEALLAAAAFFPYHGASSNRVNADRARTREMHDGAVLLRGHDMRPFFARGCRAGWLRARTATRAHSRPRAQSAGCSPACACRTKRAARPASPPARAPAPWPAAVCSGLKPNPDMPGGSNDEWHAACPSWRRQLARGRQESSGCESWQRSHGVGDQPAQRGSSRWNVPHPITVRT